MKRILAALALVMFLSTAAFGAVNTYQVTGPVLETNKDMVTVQKGKERWEIALNPDTKVTGDLKVGSKVTIEYRMTAAGWTSRVKPKQKTNKYRQLNAPALSRQHLSGEDQ